LLIEVPDHPPAARFPQARAAQQGGDRALVMMAGVASNGRWPIRMRQGPNGNTSLDFAVDGLQFR
jgi:hypothetical protein